MNTSQNLWDEAETLFRGKFIPLNVYIRIEKMSKIKNVSFHFRKLEEEQIKSKMSRRKRNKNWSRYQ